MGALTCMKAGYVRAEFADGALMLFCDDDITAGLLKAEPTQSKVRDAAMSLHGSPLKLRIYEPGKNGALMLFCDDDITAGLLKAEPTQSKVRDAAMSLHGSPLKLRIYEPGKNPKKKQDNTEIDEVLQKAQSLDIEITELN